MSKVNKKWMMIVLAAVFVLASGAAVCASGIVNLRRGAYAAEEAQVDFTQVVSGEGHSIALSSRGEVYAWGRNANGQVGNGQAGETVLSPVKLKLYDGDTPLSSDAKVVAVYATKDASAALVRRRAGDALFEVYTWGAAYENGTTDAQRWQPQLLKAANGNAYQVKSLSSGYRHFAALTNENKLLAWGDNTYGQVNGKAKANERPTPVSATVSVYGRDGAHLTTATGVNYTLNGIGDGAFNIQEVVCGYNNTLVKAEKGNVYFLMLGSNAGGYQQTAPSDLTVLSGTIGGAVLLGREQSAGGVDSIEGMLAGKITKGTSLDNVKIGYDFLYTVVSGSLYGTGKNPQTGSDFDENALMTDVAKVVTAGREAGGDNYVTAVLTKTDAVVKIFGKHTGHVWGTGTDGASEIAPADAVQASFIGDGAGYRIQGLWAGCGSVQVLDSNKRIHIFGENNNTVSGGRDLGGKFPSVKDPATSTAAKADSNLPLIYNFGTYEKNASYEAPEGRMFYDGTKFVMLVRQNADDLGNPNAADVSASLVKDGRGEKSFHLTAAELLAAVHPGFTGEAPVETGDAAAFIAAAATLNTRFGSFAVPAPSFKLFTVADNGTETSENYDNGSFFTVSDSGDGITVLSDVAADRTKPIDPNQYIEVTLYVAEYANGTVSDGAVVGVVPVTLQFRYGDYKPQAGAAVSFEGDANAKKNESGVKTALDYAESPDRYKTRTFRAEDLVTDPDNGAGTLAFVKDSISMNGLDGILGVTVDENDKGAITFVADKVTTGGTVTIEVQDDYGESVRVQFNIKITASPSDVLKVDALDYKVAEDATKNEIEIRLADWYDDSSLLVFRQTFECNSYITVTPETAGENANRILRISCQKNYSGTVRVLGSVGLAGGSQDLDVPFVLNLTFRRNVTPAKREDLPNLEDGAILLDLNKAEFTVDQLFSDADGDAMRMEIVKNGSKDLFKAEVLENGTKLVVTPNPVNGEDSLAIAVTDAVGNSKTYTLKFRVQNQYTSPIISVGMNARVVDASYLATFLYNKNLTFDERSGAAIAENPAPVINNEANTHGSVQFEVSKDRKQITLIPKTAGDVYISLSLEVGGTVTAMRVNVRVVTQLTQDASIVIDTDNMKGEQYELTIKELIETLHLTDGVTQLNPQLFQFESVYLRGDEEYARAALSSDDKSKLFVYPLMNTPETEAMDTAGSQPQYIQVVISSINGSEKYAVAVPITVTGLKLFPTAEEYNQIFIYSCVGAGVVILVLIIISFGLAAKHRHDYEEAMERIKARDRLKKAQALGASKDQMLKRGLGQNVKIKPSQQAGSRMGMSQMPPQSMGQVPGSQMNPNMNASRMMPGASQMNPNMGMSQMNPNPSQMGRPAGPMAGPMAGPQPGPVQAQAAADDDSITRWDIAGEEVEAPVAETGRGKASKNKRGSKRSSSMLALDSSEEPDHSESLPPLKAQTHVPKNARDEIENKIQARIAQEQALRQQQEEEQADVSPDKKKKKAKKEEEPDDGSPKMSKAERKKQEMLEKLRAKMMADRNK